MKIRISSAMMPGIASFSVIWRKVCEMPAPLIIEASSNEASLERNTEDSSRKAKGEKSMPSMTIMPHRL
jgi:hypothetical protein